MSGPLAGVRVLDFSLLLPGPYATRLLADLGAEVIKVEPPGGDPIVSMLPGLYEFLNRGKQALRVDLKNAAGVELVSELAAGIDVVLEGFRPGVADRLGVGFEAISAIRPGIVYCSLTGYGQFGPRSSHPGHNIGFEAGGGAFATLLAIGQRPPEPYVAVGDLGGAHFAALTIAAHLADRDRAESVQLDVAMEEAVAYFAVPRFSRYLNQGEPPELEELGPYAPGAGIFKTADGAFVALAAVEDQFWAAFCTAFDREDLAAAPYDRHAGRMAARDELRAVVSDAVGARDAAELFAICKRHGVPADPVRTVEELFADEHLRARGLVGPGENGAAYKLDYPVLADGVRSHAGSALPDPDDDPDRVLAALGLSPERISALRDSGALAQRG
jgi:CoA:oxalate CoA-transferase